MRKANYVFGLILALATSAGFVACGGDDDGDSYADSGYRLTYNGTDYNPYISWNGAWAHAHLHLEFDKGIPKGSDWYLDCDANWVKLRNKTGKVNTTVDNIPITIENNMNYEDREAVVYLDVPNGLASSTWTSTVVIHQYGFGYYLSMANTISFKTNRSKAESSKLTIEKLTVWEVMEVDWGDGSKDVLTTIDYESTSNLSISHEYKSNKTFTVGLRFAPSKDIKSYSFLLRKNQGVESLKYYDGGAVTCSVNDSKNVSVSYSDNYGYKVNQY